MYMIRKMRCALCAAFLFVIFQLGMAEAVALDPGEQLHLRFVSPIPNNTTVRVWGSKYYPGDVLSERMTEYFYQRLRQVSHLSVSTVPSADPQRWSVSNVTASDAVVHLALEQAEFIKSDRLGSKVSWDVAFHMYVYNALSKRLVFETIVREKDSRLYPLYTDMFERRPIYWSQFENSPYWEAIRHALDKAFSEVVSGYNGYRVIGRIVARAERVDGSLSVPKKDRDKIFHITIGREDTIREGDILSVTRSSSVRTIDPESPEMHFPQVVGRVKVIFVKGSDAVVQVTKQTKEAPIMVGDAVSAPLYGERKSGYFYTDTPEHESGRRIR